MTKRVYAYDRETGKKHLIPESWLSHPHEQFKKFRKTPLQKKSESGQSPAPEPVKKNTNTTESEG